ncbi:MAG: sigma-70 family RNA polymerase sigma factor [Bacteroidota bacterium]
MDKNCDTAQLFRAYQAPLLAFIQARGPSGTAAEDILQDTFMRFEECCQTGCQCEYPKAYLFRMAQHRIADFFQEQKREARIASEWQQLPREDSPAEMPCDIYQCTRNFLACLSPENQQAFIQSDIEQLPQRQIAQALGIPESTLKSRVQRTRAYLKRRFEACFKKYAS